MEAFWSPRTAQLFMKNMWAMPICGKRILITDSTPLHIASTSKTFTAMAILRLVQENKLITG